MFQILLLACFNVACAMQSGGVPVEGIVVAPTHKMPMVYGEHELFYGEHPLGDRIENCRNMLLARNETFESEEAIQSFYDTLQKKWDHRIDLNNAQLAEFAKHQCRHIDAYVEKKLSPCYDQVRGNFQRRNDIYLASAACSCVVTAAGVWAVLQAQSAVARGAIIAASVLIRKHVMIVVRRRLQQQEQELALVQENIANIFCKKRNTICLLQEGVASAHERIRCEVDGMLSNNKGKALLSLHERQQALLLQKMRDHTAHRVRSCMPAPTSIPSEASQPPLQPASIPSGTNISPDEHVVNTPMSAQTVTARAVHVVQSVLAWRPW